MINFRRLYITIWIAFFAVVSAFAQISVRAPRQVAAGEQFRLQYVVSTTDVKGFRAGNIPDGFEVLMGPSTSTQQSFQIINGHTSQSSSVTYTYILCAVKNGTFTIPGAHATVDGKAATSEAVKIVVSGKVQQAPQQQQQRGGGMQQQRGAAVRPQGSHISGNDLFITVTANKKRVHEQEPILLTYKVFTQVELTQLQGKMPDLNGFHTQEVPLPQQKSFHLETVNGRPYRCVTWSQYVMYPQMTGKLEIPSITFKGIVVQENTNIDPFEAFFNGGSGYVEVKKDIVAPSVSIQVDPLPAKPANFSGGVGTFSISSSLDHNTVKAGDPVSVRVVISGNGNLKLVHQPELQLPKDFDKYDPKVTDKTKLTSTGLTGSMIYDFLIVPRNQGKYDLPPVELTYFDTQANTYKTVKTEPLHLEVEKGNGRSADVADYSQQQDTDIRAIHTGDTELIDHKAYFFGSSVYMVVNALVLLIFITLLIVFRKQAMEMADMTQFKGKRANKVAGKRLKKAAKLMAAGNSSEFYDEVLRALWGYVSDKLSMPASELSRDNISERLASRNVDEAVIASFIEALEECEFERYAPGDAAGNMQKTYETAVSAITNIEDGMKKKRQAKSQSAYGILLLMFSMVLSMTATDSFAQKQQGDAAYAKGNYQEAITIYERTLKKGESADVYYNLGNAYYRTDNIPRAIICYERAHLLSPGDEDVIHNLETARSKTIDNIPVENSIVFASWFNRLVSKCDADGWGYVALVSLVLSLVLFLVYLFMSNLTVRKNAFWFSVVFFVLFVSGNVFAWHLRSYATHSDGAVVLEPVVNVKKTPAQQGADACVIHEGTRVDILDNTLKGWLQIRLADGREGWISDKTVERLR